MRPAVHGEVGVSEAEFVVEAGPIGEVVDNDVARGFVVEALESQVPSFTRTPFNSAHKEGDPVVGEAEDGAVDGQGAVLQRGRLRWERLQPKALSSEGKAQKGQVNVTPVGLVESSQTWLRPFQRRRKGGPLCPAAPAAIAKSRAIMAGSGHNIWFGAPV